MTAKEKAKELLLKFGKKVSLRLAKQCATICADEILNLDVWDYPHNAELSTIFWQSVKEEINNL